MPTLLLVKGYRFFFYSNENNESARVHVIRGEANDKIWLEPVKEITYMHGFNTKEEQEILGIGTNNFDTFKDKWNEYFNK